MNQETTRKLFKQVTGQVYWFGAIVVMVLGFVLSVLIWSTW